MDYNSDQHVYEEPTKRINDMGSLARFQSSPCAMDLTMFIVETQKAVKSTKMTETHLTPNLQPLADWLDHLNALMDEVPPIEQPMRFGNKAFKTWIEKVNETLDSHLTKMIETANPNFTQTQNAIKELRAYLLESFGSNERIDYGTGHELNFFVFLYCMCKIGVYGVADYKCLINKVFQRYLEIMRRLQTYYFLEPAGSHGVWGLDDYQHLAFLFGASQLIDNLDGYDPNSIHDDRALADKDNYMYFGCIAFIKQVKKGVPFYESSPMLNDISAVPHWDKVA